jgi:hypothetical protein
VSALLDFVLAPAAEARGPSPASAPAVAVTAVAVPAVAVVAARGDALLAGASAAVALARRARAGAGLVCVWDPGALAGGWRLPPSRGARRLAGALGARGHEAAAAGRAVVVTLATDPGAAALEARHAIAAAGSAPAVLALGGVREAAFDPLLREQDVVLVALRAQAAGALGALAVEGLAALGVPVRACPISAGAPVRSLARAGGFPVPALRAALADAVGAPA